LHLVVIVAILQIDKFAYLLVDLSLGRLVLMSATADITRYKEYFRDVGRGERVEVIAIPSSPRTSIFQRKVLYLEQVNIVFFFVLVHHVSLNLQ